MTVRVRFLATFKALFGGPARALDLPEGTTVGGLLDVLCDTPQKRREVLGAGGVLKSQVVVMRNGSPAGLADPLAAGDTVAVFPFVTGG
jgi:molybdopterin converting factor small subunit